MSCPSQSTQIAEFHKVILTTQLIDLLVSSFVRFTPRKYHPVPTELGLDRSHRLSGRLWEEKYLLLPPVFEPRTVQSTATHNTACTPHLKYLSKAHYRDDVSLRLPVGYSLSVALSVGIMITGRLQLVSRTDSWCCRLLLLRPVHLHSVGVKG
jgi:hypothetical protein